MLRIEWVGKSTGLLLNCDWINDWILPFIRGSSCKWDGNDSWMMHEENAENELLVLQTLNTSTKRSP